MYTKQSPEVNHTIWGGSSLLSHKNEIILVALTIFALGGAIMNGLGFFGYLPSQTGLEESSISEQS